MVQGLSYATSPARQHRPHLSTQSFLTSVCVPGGVRPPLQVGYSLRVNYYTGRVVIDPFQPLNERRSYLSTSLNSTPRSTLARPTTHRQCVTYILVHQYHARAKFTVNIYLASWPRLLNTHPWWPNPSVTARQPNNGCSRVYSGNSSPLKRNVGFIPAERKHSL